MRHIRPTLDTLVELADELPGTERLWHLRRVGWLLNAFGRTRDAYELLTKTLPETRQHVDDGDSGFDRQLEDDKFLKVRSSLLYEIANLEVTRGNLEKALSLYEESLNEVFGANRGHQGQGRLALDLDDGG